MIEFPPLGVVTTLLSGVFEKIMNYFCDKRLQKYNGRHISNHKRKEDNPRSCNLDEDDKIDYYDDYGHLIRTEKAPTYDD